MTAFNVVSQPKYGCIHVASDAAIYVDGIGVTGFNTKVVPLQHLNCVITGNGERSVIVAVANALGLERDFDTLVENAPGTLPLFAEQLKQASVTQIVIAGVSETRGPEFYNFRVGDRLPEKIADMRDAFENSPGWSPNPGEIVKMSEFVNAPPAAIDDVIAADFDGFDVDEPPDVVVWNLLKCLEMQRQLAWSTGEGHIGGFAQLTTVTSEGITQRILKRWPDIPFVGDIFPEPIDWKQWHIDNPKPGTLSRLKRSIAERKAAKRSMPLHVVQ